MKILIVFLSCIWVPVYSQAVPEREMRERMTVVEEKVSNVEVKVTNLSEQFNELSQKIEKGLTTWQCAANCGKQESGYGEIWFSNKGYLIGEGPSSGAAFSDLLKQCQAVLKIKKPDETLLQVFTDPAGKFSANMVNSCLKN